MRDAETVIRHPHSSTVTQVKGKKVVEVHDDRLSVAITEGGATLTLFFPAETGWAGEDAPLEIRLAPSGKGKESFEPWRLMPKLPLYLAYARASLAHRDGDIRSALKALREAGTSRRGLSDDFYSQTAESYKAIVAEGEKYPIKALAEEHFVDISTASRWIKEARRRGYLPGNEKGTRRA
jgi:hypothetical protein